MKLTTNTVILFTKYWGKVNKFYGICKCLWSCHHHGIFIMNWTYKLAKVIPETRRAH